MGLATQQAEGFGNPPIPLTHDLKRQWEKGAVLVADLKVKIPPTKGDTMQNTSPRGAFPFSLQEPGLKSLNPKNTPLSKGNLIALGQNTH